MNNLIYAYLYPQIDILEKQCLNMAFIEQQQDIILLNIYIAQIQASQKVLSLFLDRLPTMIKQQYDPTTIYTNTYENEISILLDFVPKLNTTINLIDKKYDIYQVAMSQAKQLIFIITLLESAFSLEQVFIPISIHTPVISEPTYLLATINNSTIEIYDNKLSDKILIESFFDEAEYIDQKKSMVIAPNGKFLITICEDENIRLWNAKIGLPIFSMHTGKKFMLYVTISPDSTTIAYHTKNYIHIHNLIKDPNTIAIKSPNQCKEYIKKIIFSPNNEKIAMLTLSHIYIIDIALRETIKKFKYAYPVRIDDIMFFSDNLLYYIYLVRDPLKLKFDRLYIISENDKATKSMSINENPSHIKLSGDYMITLYDNNTIYLVDMNSCTKKIIVKDVIKKDSGLYQYMISNGKICIIELDGDTKIYTIETGQLVAQKVIKNIYSSYFYSQI